MNVACGRTLPHGALFNRLAGDIFIRADQALAQQAFTVLLTPAVAG